MYWTRTARIEGRPRRSVDVELLEVPRPPAVLLPLDPVTNRPRLGVVDKAQARITLANPLSQEGERQAVALGRTRIESANCVPGRISPTPGIPILTVVVIAKFLRRL